MEFPTQHTFIHIYMSEYKWVFADVFVNLATSKWFLPVRYTMYIYARFHRSNTNSSGKREKGGAEWEKIKKSKKHKRIKKEIMNMSTYKLVRRNAKEHTTTYFRIRNKKWKKRIIKNSTTSVQLAIYTVAVAANTTTTNGKNSKWQTNVKNGNRKKFSVQHSTRQRQLCGFARQEGKRERGVSAYVVERHTKSVYAYNSYMLLLHLLSSVTKWLADAVVRLPLRAVSMHL